MSTAVNTDAATGKRIRARKDAERKDVVIKMGELRDRIDELLALRMKCAEATKEYREAITAVAEKAGLQVGVVRKFVAARSSEAYDDKKLDAEQLSLCFDEIGR